MLTLPKKYQFTDYELRQMTVEQMKCAFEDAEKDGILNEFADAFWTNAGRARSDPNYITIQNVVNSLEARKRDLGRKYCNTLAKYRNKAWLATLIAIQYNDVEYQIRWLCLNYKVERESLPYLLEV